MSVPLNLLVNRFDYLQAKYLVIDVIFIKGSYRYEYLLTFL